MEYDYSNRDIPPETIARLKIKCRQPEPPPAPEGGHTCESLRLDLQVAMSGETWKILPLGFRGQDAAKTYPLPTKRGELQKIVAVPLPKGRRDNGCIYITRAIDALRKSLSRRQAAVYDVSKLSDQVQAKSAAMTQAIQKARATIQVEVNRVRDEAQESVSGLRSLFAMGREGMERMMRAHLNNEPVNADENGEGGEMIDAKAFRECFRMVYQAVHGLGIPTGQEKSAKGAILQEAAEAIRDTQDALSLAPGSPEDKPQ